MDIPTTLKELSDRLGPPRPRAAFGQWTPYAWLVRGLVEQGHGISDAVNHVLVSSGFAKNKQAFGSLRAAYYKVKDKEWPPGFAAKPGPAADEDTETGFE
jgi:hypothetical protein